MELQPFFKSILEQDRCSVVICDLAHTIIYMNPAARKKYGKHGNLLGKSLLDCHNTQSNEMIKRVVEWFAADKSHNIIYTFHNEKENRDVYMVALRDGDQNLIGYYEKHEYRNPETEQRYDFG